MANIDFAFVSCICMKGLSVLFAQAGAHDMLSGRGDGARVLLCVLAQQCATPKGEKC